MGRGQNRNLPGLFAKSKVVALSKTKGLLCLTANHTGAGWIAFSFPNCVTLGPERRQLHPRDKGRD